MFGFSDLGRFSTGRGLDKGWRRAPEVVQIVGFFGTTEVVPLQKRQSVAVLTRGLARKAFLWALGGGTDGPCRLCPCFPPTWFLLPVPLSLSLNRSRLVVRERHRDVLPVHVVVRCPIAFFRPVVVLRLRTDRHAGLQFAESRLHLVRVDRRPHVLRPVGIYRVRIVVVKQHVAEIVLFIGIHNQPHRRRVGLLVSRKGEDHKHLLSVMRNVVLYARRSGRLDRLLNVHLLRRRNQPRG